MVHVVTDFYVGYNHLPGPHQRCWVHLLRDLHKLKEQHGKEVRVRQWAVPDSVASNSLTPTLNTYVVI